MTTSDANGLVDTLADFVASTRYSDIPGRVTATAKACLLHNLGVAIAGQRAEPYAHRIAQAHYASPAEATLLASGQRASIEGAAFANAALIHARTQDDAHTPSSTHPGATVTPAALAIAESAGLTGRDFLAALVLGYDIQGRIGRDYDTITTPRGFRATTIYGVFGAAAASAKLLGHSKEQIARTLAFAAHLAGGLGCTWAEGSDEWRLQVGMAARHGVVAARMGAQAIPTGHFTLEGPAGFFRAFGGTAEHASAVSQSLGTQWQIDEVTLKKYPCCAILQGPVGELLKLVTSEGLAPHDVAEIRAVFNPYEAHFPGTNYAGPFNSQGGTLMSAPFCLALVLAERRMSLDGLLRFDDPRVLELLARVKVEADPDLPMQSGKLIVATTSDRSFHSAWSAESATPPVTFDDVANGVSELLDSEGPRHGLARNLIAAVEDLDDAPSLESLTQCFRT